MALETATKGALTIANLSFTTGPGITGHILLLILFTMFVTAVEKVRRSKFEVFSYIHHLFILFFLITALHGAFCFIKVDKADVCNGGGSSWKWFIASGVVYAIERILREWRGHRNTEILKVIQHPSKVVQIQIKKTARLGKPGQYVFICCPELSLFQWHPFTLTSAPNEDFYSVHIRVVGDWTKALADRLGCQFNKTGSIPRLAMTTLPMIMVDGPYGTASEDVYDYEVSVLVGAGIGVVSLFILLLICWTRHLNWMLVDSLFCSLEGYLAPLQKQ
jgi:NADPH oxidase